MASRSVQPFLPPNSAAAAIGAHLPSCRHGADGNHLARDGGLPWQAGRADRRSFLPMPH